MVILSKAVFPFFVTSYSNPVLTEQQSTRVIANFMAAVTICNDLQLVITANIIVDVIFKVQTQVVSPGQV